MPPDTEITALPSHNPLHDTLFWVTNANVGAFGFDNDIVAVPVHELLSVAVIVYIVPAHKPAKFPLVGCVGPAGNMLNTYGAVPPDTTFADAVPSQPGTQVGDVPAVVFTTMAPGCVI